MIFGCFPLSVADQISPGLANAQDDSIGNKPMLVLGKGGLDKRCGFHSSSNRFLNPGAPRSQL